MFKGKMMFRRLFISICFIFLYSVHYGQSTSKNTSLKEQQCIDRFAEMEMYGHVREMGAFWRNDSLGSNGFRKYFTAVYLLTSKDYKGVDYELVKKHFGNGIPMTKGDKNFVYLNYIIFDPSKMGPEFKEYNVLEMVYFKFDATSKKLHSIYKQ